jgi:hypothetical protein
VKQNSNNTRERGNRLHKWWLRIAKIKELSSVLWISKVQAGPSEGESEFSLTIHGTRLTEESQHHCFQMMVSFMAKRISRDDCPIDEEISNKQLRRRKVLEENQSESSWTPMSLAK